MRDIIGKLKNLSESSDDELDQILFPHDPPDQDDEEDQEEDRPDMNNEAYGPGGYDFGSLTKFLPADKLSQLGSKEQDLMSEWADMIESGRMHDVAAQADRAAQSGKGSSLFQNMAGKLAQALNGGLQEERPRFGPDGAGMYGVSYIYPDESNIGNDKFETEAEAKRYAKDLKRKGYKDVYVSVGQEGADYMEETKELRRIAKLSGLGGAMGLSNNNLGMVNESIEEGCGCGPDCGCPACAGDQMQEPMHAQNRDGMQWFDIRALSEEELDYLENLTATEAGPAGALEYGQDHGMEEFMVGSADPDVVMFLNGACGVQEEYANSPDEEYQDTDFMMNKISGGLNDKKDMYISANDGDSPMSLQDVPVDDEEDEQVRESVSQIMNSLPYNYTQLFKKYSESKDG